ANKRQNYERTLSSQTVRCNNRSRKTGTNQGRMVLLQNKLNLKVAQKQILTPGLVQMVSVLALNKLELREMINTEMVENPVLEELDSSVPLLDEVAGREEARDREAAQELEAAKGQESAPEAEKKDPFDEIDFGSFFRDYLDPGYRSSSDLEEIERPSFENFLSKPTNLTDHLMWQLGSLNVTRRVHAAAELVIGNLNEEGYLTASEDELLGIVAVGDEAGQPSSSTETAVSEDPATLNGDKEASHLELVVSHTPSPEAVASNNHLSPVLQFTREDLQEAIRLIRHFDPVGVAARDLRDTREMEGSDDPENDQVIEDALKIVDGQLHLLQNKQYREIAKAIGRTM